LQQLPDLIMGRKKEKWYSLRPQFVFQNIKKSIVQSGRAVLVFSGIHTGLPCFAKHPAGVAHP